LVVEIDESASAWTTAQLEVTILAKPVAQALPVEATRVALEEEGGWTLEKPAGWRARVFLSDLDQSTRGLDGAAMRLPPGLDNPAAFEYFRPVRMHEGTWVHPSAPAVMGITSAADQLAMITPEQPLRVEVTVADEPGLAGIAPVGFDGVHFFLAGKPIDVDHHPTFTGGVRRLACTIDCLPAPADEVAEGRGEVTRDLQRAVRLFFYKLFLGALPTDSGLRQADVVDGRVIYRPIAAADISQSKRVALMLHGFTGDTRWMVEQVWSWVRRQGNYDLCLTYDFETFGTGIKRNADMLTIALQEVGIGPGSPVQLDIFGHSMGTQIARAMIELGDGEKFVDRVFMAGPPNAGTPLASGRSLLPWLADILVNLAGSAPPALIAHWLLGLVSEAGRGLADLAPDSPFYEELNAGWRPPARVPYYVQIGDNSASHGQWKTLAQKVAGTVDAGLDLLYGGDNDLLVGVKSARWLEGRWPRLQVQILSGNHFQYFTPVEGQRVLARWLS
jgi:pimeloyl-ACP methyl ester carboxylesterase